MKSHQSGSRRSFITKLSAASAGVAFGGALFPGESSALFGRGGSEVSLLASTDRRQAAFDVLKPLKDDIVKAIGNRQVIIKANAGVGTKQAIVNSTHVDQIRGILDFLKEHYGRRVIVAEGIASPAHSVFVSYENYNYLPLEKEYDVKLIDLNDQPTERHYILEGIHRPRPVNLITTLLDPDNFIISATRPKTHNAVIITLSLKNVAMGTPWCNYKSKDTKNRNEKYFMHGGEGQALGRELSYNLFRVAEAGGRPDLAILDGVEGIEGDGPWGGEVIEHGVALASLDFVACDRLAIELMGADPREMKYIQWCGDAGMGEYDLSNIKVTGANYKKHIVKYRMSSTADEQRAWIYENGLIDK